MTMSAARKRLRLTNGSCGGLSLIASDFNYSSQRCNLSHRSLFQLLRRAMLGVAYRKRRALLERALDDAVYLACAVDGEAHLLTTEESDLRLLGDTYQDVPIVSWREL